MKLIWEKAIAEFTSTNPHQTMATFIFADDKPNLNKQGLPFSEFENIRKSAIGMPVKMKFTGYGASDHEGSLPIGVIADMEIVTLAEDHHQLIAKAALWNDEFPEEVAWLKKAFAEGKAPGISYEVNYEDFNVQDSVKWLSNTFTGAATFVRVPAYGTRTALLSLASIQNNTELEAGLIKLVEQLEKPKPNKKGGNQMDELEQVTKERDNFKAEAASKQDEITNLQTALTEKDSTISTLQGEIDQMKAAAVIDARVRRYAEAGFNLDTDAEKANIKKTLFASFDDAQWEAYLEDLLALKATIPAPATPHSLALASLRTNKVPRLEVEAETSYQSLKAGLKELARPNG